MVTRLCGDHFVEYENNKLLCCMPEINITLYINFNSINRVDNFY